MEKGRRNDWLCVVINLLACPGLGTIMKGRRSGYFQAAIMVAGFVLVIWFFLVVIVGAIRVLSSAQLTEEDFAAFYQPQVWALKIGLPLCAIAWCWALISSISILRAGRQPRSSL